MRERLVRTPLLGGFVAENRRSANRNLGNTAVQQQHTHTHTQTYAQHEHNPANKSCIQVMFQFPAAFFVQQRQPFRFLTVLPRISSSPCSLVALRSSWTTVRKRFRSRAAAAVVHHRTPSLVCSFDFVASRHSVLPPQQDQVHAAG